MPNSATQYGTAVCCRTWTVVLVLDGHSYVWRECGICDVKPVLTATWWE